MTVPRTVRCAGYITVAQAVVALGVAVVLVFRGFSGADQRIVNGFATAVWFAAVGAVVGAAGWALITGQRWGRGIAVFANFLLIPVTWYIIESGQLLLAASVAAVAVLVLGLLFSPSAISWAARSRN